MITVSSISVVNFLRVLGAVSALTAGYVVAPLIDDAIEKTRLGLRHWQPQLQQP